MGQTVSGLGTEIGPGLQVIVPQATRPPTLRYFGPVPYVRCFSSVRPDRPRNGAASGVRRKRGGRPFLWRGPASGGWLKATMEKQPGAGDNGWPRFGPLAIPLDRALSTSTTGVAQQIEISAVHQLQPRPHQSDRATTKVVRLPGGAGRNTSFIEEGFGNLAIGRTGQMTIESAERKQELLTLRAREAIGWSSGAPACQEPPEAQSRIGACSKIGIERVHRRDRRVNLEGAHEQQRKTTSDVADDPILAVTRATPENRGQ